MLNRQLLSILFIVILFSGCGNSPKPIKKPEQLPAWIESPVPSNDKYMYGIGVSSDRESAIKEALNDMTSKVGTTIESTYESNEELQGSYYKANFKNQIKASVAKIKINNYELVKSHRVNYAKFAVMIMVDKKKFIDGLITELNYKKNKIEQEFSFLENKHAVQRYNTMKKLTKDSDELLYDVTIISELDNSFDKKSYIELINRVKTKFLNEQKSLNFYVLGDDNSRTFVSKIKDFLANQGFNLSNKKQDSVVIYLRTTDNIVRSNSINIAVLTLDIDVTNNSKEIGGKTIILKERYNDSKHSVYKNAAIHFEQDIKSQGINETIGINLNLD